MISKHSISVAPWHNYIYILLIYLQYILLKGYFLFVF